MDEHLSSNAERSLFLCNLFESELLIWLLLKNWKHPLSENQEFRNDLLESATSLLEAASSQGQQEAYFQGMPACDMNLISAIWYVEQLSIDDEGTIDTKEKSIRRKWLDEVRRTLPSCFCPLDDLPS